MSKKPNAVVLMQFLSSAQEGEPIAPRFFVRQKDRLVEESIADDERGYDFEFISSSVALPEEVDLKIANAKFTESDSEENISLEYFFEPLVIADHVSSAIIDCICMEYQGVEYCLDHCFFPLNVSRGEKIKLTYKMEGNCR